MIAALSFLTIVGSGSSPDHRSMRWFGVVGALIGGVVGAVWWAAAQVASPVMAAALAVAVDLILTGMLHLDGLADGGDGLLPHMDRERRLAVMSEPTIGAFGVVVVAMTLILRVAAISSLTVDAAAIASVAALWALARVAMVLTALVVPYARPGGIASAFMDRSSRHGAVRGTTLLAAGLSGGAALAGIVVAAGWLGLAAGLASLAAMAGVVALSRRRLGGFTGDVLGALGVIGETVGLLVAGTTW